MTTINELGVPSTISKSKVVFNLKEEYEIEFPIPAKIKTNENESNPLCCCQFTEIALAISSRSSLPVAPYNNDIP